MDPETPSQTGHSSDVPSPTDTRVPHGRSDAYAADNTGLSESFQSTDTVRRRPDVGYGWSTCCRPKPSFLTPNHIIGDKILGLTCRARRNSEQPDPDPDSGQQQPAISRGISSSRAPALANCGSIFHPVPSAGTRTYQGFQTQEAADVAQTLCQPCGSTPRRGLLC